MAHGITINGLVVLHQRRNFSWPPIPDLDRYFRHCVIGGPGAFMVVVETAAAFAGAVRRKLIREIANRMGNQKGPIRLPAAGAGPAGCGAAGWENALPASRRSETLDLGPRGTL